MRLPSFLWLTRRHVPLWLVLLIGTALSSLVFQIKQEAASDRQRAVFSEFAHETIRRFQWELEVHIDALQSLRDFMRASPETDREGFASFGKGAMRRAFAVRSVQWIPLVPEDQRQVYEARALGEGVEDFAFFRLGKRGERLAAESAEVYFPVYFIEPISEDREFLGLDVAELIDRHEALPRAWNHAGATAVVPGAALSPLLDEFEVAFLLPVFATKNGEREISGFVSAILDIPAVCDRVVQSEDGLIELELSAPRGEEETLVPFFSTGTVPAAEQVRKDVPIAVGDRQWRLGVVADDRLLTPEADREGWGVLAIGLVGTGLVTVWVRQRQVYVQSVEIQVNDRTAALARINEDLQNEMVQRRRAEISLGQSEARFREAFLHAPIGIALLSPKGEWLQVNEALSKMTGLTEAELQTRTIADMLHPDEVNEELARMGQLLAGEIRTFALEHRFRHKSGGFIWVLMNVSQVRGESGKLLYFICQILDITERKQALEETRRAQQFSENIINSSIDGIIAFDPQGRFTVWNSGMEKMTGIPVAEALGRSAQEVLPFLTEPEGETRAFRRVLAGQTVRSAERPFTIPSNGRSGFYTAHLAPLHSENGAIAGGVAVVHDVTAELTARKQLQATAEMLRQRNRELQDFAYVASHDLQEPLRKIRAFGDRLAKKAEGQLDEQAGDYLHRMQDAAGRMQTLIADLLAFSRVSTEANPFVKVDLGVIAREVLSDLETRIEETAAEVEVGELPVIEGDPTQMRQLFQNLLSNGLKYRKSDQPCRLRVYATEPPVADGGLPTLGLPGSLLHFEDNGIGFDEKYLDRIFTVFQRLHGRSEYAGTGVGLAIVRRIVERHHGWITASSAPGKGATFIVALPHRQASITE